MKVTQFAVAMVLTVVMGGTASAQQASDLSGMGSFAERATFNLQPVEPAAVLQIIQRRAGVELKITPEAEALIAAADRVVIKLEKVPYEVVFKLMVRATGCTYTVIDEHTIQIAPLLKQ